jgi:hypothetical protein
MTVMIIFFFLSNFFLLNMVIAAVLQGYDQESKAENHKLSGEEHEIFRRMWEEYDPHGTQLISTHQYKDFLSKIKGRMGVSSN